MEPKEERNNPQEPVNPPADPQAPSATPVEDEFMANLQKKYPDLNGDREALLRKAMESYDHDHEYWKTASAEANRLNEYLKSNEDLNNFFCEIFNRRTDHPELAFMHLKPIYHRFMNGELTSEEFIAEQQRMRDELEAAKNLEKIQEEAFAAECEARGWDAKETITKLEKIINKDCTTPEECRQQVKMMFRILEWDDALAAAETRGRNAKIKEGRRNHPSGEDLPRNGGTPAGGTEPKKSLLGQAADAEAKRRAAYES